jgi:hypothetical protein
MTTALEPEVSTYRWSSQDEADRLPVEDPATGEVITLVQGGGTAQVNAAVEAATARSRHWLGIRRQLVIAPLITAAAVYWLSQLGPGSSYFGSLFVPLVLAGASIGVTFVPMTMAATTGVPPAEAAWRQAC